MTAFDKSTDTELLELLIKGNETAFAQIFHRYWKKLLAIAYHHTRDKAIAQEIVQELFVGLWNRRQSYNILSLGNYLAVATRFSVYKYMEKERRRKEVESAGSIADFDNGESALEVKFLREFIATQIEQLPEKCKLVFRSSRMDGKSIKEIAEEMNLSEKTVEAHLTKGLKVIRNRLRNSGLYMLFRIREICFSYTSAA